MSGVETGCAGKSTDLVASVYEGGGAKELLVVGTEGVLLLGR